MGQQGSFADSSKSGNRDDSYFLLPLIKVPHELLQPDERVSCEVFVALLVLGIALEQERSPAKLVLDILVDYLVHASVSL